MPILSDKLLYGDWVKTEVPALSLLLHATRRKKEKNGRPENLYIAKAKKLETAYPINLTTQLVFVSYF